MSLTTVAYDPKTTATQLATQLVQEPQKSLDADIKQTGVLKSSISTLRSALSSFQAAAGAFTSTQSAVVSTAVFSSEVGTASAAASAQPGNYWFFVEQLAKSNQVGYSGLTDSSASAPGVLKVQIADGTSFDVDLSTADVDGNGLLSPKEVGAAINNASGNNSRISASVATFNGSSSLILTSNTTGAANAATLDTSGLSTSSLQSQLDNPASKKVFIAGQDAVIWLGGQGTGTKIQQASNTFSIIDGVKITTTKAQAAGSDPVSLTVGMDSSATASKLNALLDSYNSLVATLKTLTNRGDVLNDVAPAAFAGDSGLVALKSKIDSVFRTAVDGKSLASYGVTMQRDGKMSLDSVRFAKAFAADPSHLDKVVGSADGGGSGVVGALNKVLDGWTSRNGQLSRRESSELTLEKRLDDRQKKIDQDYANAYKRYNLQFTKLQEVQEQMSRTSNLFDALFSNSNN